MPDDLLSQAGDRQCSLPELGKKELQGMTAVTPEDMQKLQDTGMQGHEDMQRWAISSMSSTLRGAWLALGPLGIIHSVLSPLVCLSLPPSSPATPAQVRNLADLVVPTVFCVAEDDLELLGTLFSVQPVLMTLTCRLF